MLKEKIRRVDQEKKKEEKKQRSLTHPGVGDDLEVKIRLCGVERRPDACGAVSGCARVQWTMPPIDDH